MSLKENPKLNSRRLYQFCFLGIIFDISDADDDGDEVAASTIVFTTACCYSQLHLHIYVHVHAFQGPLMWCTQASLPCFLQRQTTSSTFMSGVYEFLRQDTVIIMILLSDLHIIVQIAYTSTSSSHIT